MNDVAICGEERKQSSSVWESGVSLKEDKWDYV